MEYRIDDLARAAGMSVRNVRVYQDRQLLPPPRREGRVAWYSKAHLARLRLIGRLLERGYTFAQIGELLNAVEQGKDLATVLGLEEAITAPWSDERPERLGFVELRRMFGDQATKAAIDRAVRLGLLRREGAHFRAPSLRLLQAGADLAAAGIPLPVVLDLAEAAQADLDQVAGRFVQLVVEKVLPQGIAQDVDSVDLAAVTDLVQRLRPHATRAVDALFAMAMERQIGATVSVIAERLRSTSAATVDGQTSAGE